MKNKFLIVLGALLLQAAHAAPPSGDVNAQLEVFKVDVSAADGKETLSPASSVRPGDMLEYRALYRNQGKALARNVEATLPIPADSVVYVAQSARPAPSLASTDGRLFSSVPLIRLVTLPDGQRQTQAVPLSEYRFLRWKLGDLAAGTNAVVTSRVRVTSIDTAAGSATVSDKKKGGSGNVASR